MQHIKHIWPTVKDIADDLAVPYTTAHSWIARGRIPAGYDLALIAAAKKRGKALTLKQLAEARAQPPEQLITHNALDGHAPVTHQGGQA